MFPASPNVFLTFLMTVLRQKSVSKTFAVDQAELADLFIPHPPALIVTIVNCKSNAYKYDESYKQTLATVI